MRRIVLLTFVAASSSLAGPTGDSGEAAKVSLEAALVKAKAEATKRKVDLSRQYLKSAVFDDLAAAPGTHHRCWRLWWQVPRAKGGATFISVCEDDRVDIEFGE
ncbi:MAG: hypothetical protein SFW67_08920 [Myxococcaceae bacterium]|nr:hypothetical protein [Myxococcaceae bacterium]